MSCLGLHIIPDVKPRITPPRTSPGHPVSMYPGLALKYAQTNEGIIPINIIIENSSLKIRALGAINGNLGEIGFLLREAFLTILVMLMISDLRGRNLGEAFVSFHSLHIAKLEIDGEKGLPSQTFPQYEECILS